MEEKILEMTEAIEEETEEIFDQQKFDEEMIRLCRFIWDLSNSDLSYEEMAEFARANRPALPDVMFNSEEMENLDEDDRNDIDIIVDEAIISIARSLTRISEKNRSAFQEFVLDE